MSKIISIVSHKGGVGKTTTAQNIAYELARQGKKVLAIDIDGQCNLSTISDTSLGWTTLHMLKGECSATDAIQKTAHCDIIPAGKGLEGITETLNSEIGKEYKLREAIEPIRNEYDFIIIDTPPSINVLTINALTAANEIIIPAQADLLSYEGMKQLVEVCATVKRYTNPALIISGILLTRYNSRSIISKSMLKNFKNYAESIGTKVFETQIRETTAIKEAQALKVSLFEHAPNSNAAKDYKALVAELLKGV